MEKMSEIDVLEKIGRECGYGHAMACLSALWRRSLREQGFPEIGAHNVGVRLKDGSFFSDIHTEELYDNIIKKHFEGGE